MNMRNLHAGIVTWFITQGQLWIYTVWANMALDIRVPTVVQSSTYLCSAINIKSIVSSFTLLVHLLVLFCKECLTLPHVHVIFSCRFVSLTMWLLRIRCRVICLLCFSTIWLHWCHWSSRPLGTVLWCVVLMGLTVNGCDMFSQFIWSKLTGGIIFFSAPGWKQHMYCLC